MPSTNRAQPITHSWRAIHPENGTASITTDKSTTNDDLPSASAPHLTLARPTPAERARILRLNGASWRGALPLEAYARREAHLAAQELTRAGGWAAWVLVEGAPAGDGRRDGADGHVVANGGGGGGRGGAEEAGRAVLASCETYRKRALVADPRAGRARDVWAQGVGSVYCPVEMRGRGYAGRLMRELALAGGRHGRGDEACEVSVLFSDIGKVWIQPLLGRAVLIGWSRRSMRSTAGSRMPRRT